MTETLVRCPECFENAVKTADGVTCSTCGYQATLMQFTTATYRNDQSDLAWFKAMANWKRAA